MCKYMIFRAKYSPGLTWCRPYLPSFCLWRRLHCAPASVQTENKTGSCLLAAGEYIDWECERKKRIWRSNALQWEDVKRRRAMCPFSRSSVWGFLFCWLIQFWRKKNKSCRSLLSCHVAVVPVPQHREVNMVKCVKSLLEWTQTIDRDDNG